MAASPCALFDEIDDVKALFWPSNFNDVFVTDLKIKWFYENQKLVQS